MVRAMNGPSSGRNRGLAGAALLGALLVVPACQPGKFGGLGDGGCPQMGASVDALTATFSADAKANAKIRAFVQASKDISATAVQAEALAAEACLRIGADIGVTSEQMAPRPGAGGRAQGACEAVAGAMDAIFRQGLRVSVRVTPPQCQADLQAHARCQGSCDVSVDPGQIVAQCQPAQLSGFCEGRCVGRCEGTCSGQCSGQCSAVDAQGRCNGQCSGECNGGCSATCHARCEGRWQAPQCAGHVRPPSADAECNASCNAHANVRAQCTPARVEAQASDNSELALRLVQSLQANLPMLLHAQISLGQRLAGDIRVVAQVGAQLPKIAGNAGLQGLACIAAGARATAEASVSIDVSVKASASVSGRAGAG